MKLGIYFKVSNPCESLGEHLCEQGKKYANLLKLCLSADVSLCAAGTHNVAVVTIAVIYIEYVRGPR